MTVLPVTLPVTDDPIDRIATELLEAYETGSLIEPISDRVERFDQASGYEVLDRIAARRQAGGWVPVGRKIGFTNTTIWPLFGVNRPMWAQVWDRTLVMAPSAVAEVSLDGLVQPRIEPEVAFKLAATPRSPDSIEVEWMAPAFEIVQCHYPDWRFKIGDCTAAFGLHARLVVGPPVPVASPDFEAVLSRDGQEVDRGSGTNVLGGPLLALAHLARVVADQPQYAPLAQGEIITTGTITNAFPIQPGETWTSEYGGLGVRGMRVIFT